MTDIPKRGILIFLEERDGRLSNISYEISGGAYRLSKMAGCIVTGVLLGQQVSGAVKAAEKLNLNKLIVAQDEIFKDYDSYTYADVMKSIIIDMKPELVLFGSTSTSPGICTKIAALTEKAFISDCIDIRYDENKGFLFIRPNVSGSVHQSIIAETGGIASVRPGTFAEYDGQEIVPKVVELQRGKDYNCFVNDAVRLAKIIFEKKQNVDITKAKILVSGGRGMGSPEGFAQLRVLADLLDGEVACSRACIELGWADASMQVGQTGKTVHPELYIACGISGAIQHVTGMKDSDLIIAINKNPAAPIFDVADLGIVGNLENILPVLIKTLQEKKGEANAI